MNETYDAIENILTQDVLGSYTGLLSLSDLPLMIVSKAGGVLYEFVPMPEFCKCVCQHVPGAACPELQQHLNGEVQYRCSRGLSSIVIPVVYEGETTAYVAGGNVYQEEQAYQKYMQDVQQLAGESGLEAEFVAKTLSLLRTVSKEKLSAHEQLARYIAHNISQKLYGMQQPVQSIEKDILERKIIEQEAKNGVIQINPNFLFNMLNCVARIAYFEQAEKTENLIYQLSDLLRFNAQTGMAIHTVQAELEHIEKYLYIQKARFRSRLKYAIDIPEHIRSCHILNSVLQPLVDNALVHGIMLRKDGGEIRLRATSQGERLTFFIIDNGNGFSQETLNALRENAFLNDNRSTICRINQRIKQYYGKPYGLDIVKSDVSGSTVSVTIPKNIAKR